MELLKLEKKRGISPLIATLLLIAIAVAASVLTYSWVMSMIGSQSAQAQTQVRIDSVTWVGAHAFTIDVRNLGSVAATLESVSIKENSASGTLESAAVTTSIATGSHSSVAITGLTKTLASSTSYVIRVTCNTGFYYEYIATSGTIA